jgi:uncharacterized protein YggE
MQKLENKEAASDSVKVTLIVVSTVIVLAVVALAVFLNLRPGTTITTNGQSTIKATPDLVSIYFTVDTNGSTAQEAKDKNAEIVDNVITGLIKNGIKREDITTENFNIWPEYDWTESGQVFKGYRATHSIRVQLDSNKMDDAGEVIDIGVDNGALISYINFELSTEKQNEYKAQALSDATKDAKVKAESIASGLGKRLGAVVSVVDSSFDYYPWAIYRNDAMIGVEEAKTAISTNINPGQQEVNARVTVTYKII